MSKHPWSVIAPGLGDLVESAKHIHYTHVDADGIPTETWADSGKDSLATLTQVMAVLGTEQAHTPVCVGIVDILHSASASQITSPEFWDTIDAANRDVLGPDTPVIHSPLEHV